MKRYYFALACILLSLFLLVVPVSTRYDSVSNTSTSTTVGLRVVLEEGMSLNACAAVGSSIEGRTHGFPFTTSSDTGFCGGGIAVYPVGILLDIIIAVNIIYFVRNVARWRLKR